MQDPLVSVLIPAYRAQATLGACLASLLAGDNAAIPAEILIESDDGTAYADLAVLSPRVRVAVTGQVRSGVGAARTRALARARAPMITYVDADDRVAGDYLPRLIQAAAGRAAAARTEVLDATGAPIARFGTGATLNFAQMARHGASFRGLFARAICPPFENDLSQDILHMVEVLLATGPIPLADTTYHLHLSPATVTADDTFSIDVDAAYVRHLARLATRHPDHPDLAAAEAVFTAKRALNRRYRDEAAPGESYYAFIARVTG